MPITWLVGPLVALLSEESVFPQCPPLSFKAMWVREMVSLPLVGAFVSFDNINGIHNK